MVQSFESSLRLWRSGTYEKALVVALSFCRLLGLGCPKQAFAQIATPRADLIRRHGELIVEVFAVRSFWAPYLVRNQPKEWS